MSFTRLCPTTTTTQPKCICHTNTNTNMCVVDRIEKTQPYLQRIRMDLSSAISSSSASLLFYFIFLFVFCCCCQSRAVEPLTEDLCARKRTAQTCTKSEHTQRGKRGLRASERDDSGRGPSPLPSSFWKCEYDTCNPTCFIYIYIYI